MLTIKQQIDVLRAKYRKEKIAAFKAFLKEAFGRSPVKGDVIVFPDEMGYSISEVGGPYKVNGVMWNYNAPALEVRCPTEDNKFYTSRIEALEAGENEGLPFGKGELKRARFARRDEINFSAFEWKVRQDTVRRYDKKKRKWIKGLCREAIVPTRKDATNVTRKWAREWKALGRQVGEISGFTNLYDRYGNTNTDWGHIEYSRVRKTTNKF